MSLTTYLTFGLNFLAAVVIAGPTHAAVPTASVVSHPAPAHTEGVFKLARDTEWTCSEIPQFYSDECQPSNGNYDGW